MTHKEWKDSSHALRKLVREGLKMPAEGINPDRMCEYKFALVYNTNFGYFHLWNEKTRNTIATIRISGKRAFVRYRPNSWYAGIIQGIRIPNRQTIFVKSDDLKRHTEWVRGRLGNRARNEMANFLARQTISSSVQENGSFFRLSTPYQRRTSSGIVQPPSTAEILFQQRPTEYQIQACSDIVLHLTESEDVEFLQPIDFERLCEIYTTRSQPNNFYARPGAVWTMDTRLELDYNREMTNRVEDMADFGSMSETMRDTINSTNISTSARTTPLTNEDIYRAVDTMSQTEAPDLLF